MQHAHTHAVPIFFPFEFVRAVSVWFLTSPPARSVGYRGDRRGGTDDRILRERVRAEEASKSYGRTTGGGGGGGGGDDLKNGE